MTEHVRRQLRNNGLVLGLALLIRLAVLWSSMRHQGAAWFFSRGTEMGLMAKSVVDGHGLSSPFGVETGPTALFAPVYPLFVAAVFRVTGFYTSSAAVVILLVHLAANLLTIWVIMTLARRCFDERVAVLAGLIWTLSPPLWWLPTIFWDTSITILLLTVLVLLALRLRSHGGPLPWIGFGAYCGFTVLFNPALFLTALGIAVLLVYENAPQQRWRSAALGTAVFALVFCAWPIRNATVFHAFVPLRTAVGLDLWMGNHEGSTGYLQEKLFPTYNAHELGDYKSLGEIAYTNQKMRLAKQYVEQHPGIAIALTARRFVRFWCGTGTQGGSAFFPLHALFTTLFGVVGLWLLARERTVLALVYAIPLILFPLPYYLSHAEFRFRLVIDPVMTLLAAFALARIGSRPARSSSTRERAV